MNKEIASVPLNRVSAIRLCLNRRHRSLREIQVETGADYVLNGGLFNPDWTPCALLKAGGRMRSGTPWRAWGFGWNQGPDLRLRTDYESVENFLSCVCLLRGGRRQPLGALPPALDGARARSAMGTADGRLVLFCCRDAVTPGALQRELEQLGCTDAVMLDGGGSSQCDFRGRRIISARPVQNLLLVYEKPHCEEDKGMNETQKLVCLDPGHGPGCANGSPDGAYLEREFAWDMYVRLCPLLEARGVKVIGTREENSMPSLTRRATISNRAGADLFVSLHSNAAGNDGWYDAKGFKVYTSSPGNEAGRNRAARALIRRAAEGGITIRGSGLGHAMFTVLAKTTAPAVLIEFGFHTNRAETALLRDSAYRDRLARITARGICDYLGVKWPAEMPQQEEDRLLARRRFGLSDPVMDYLDGSPEPADLFYRLAHMD